MNHSLYILNDIGNKGIHKSQIFITYSLQHEILQQYYFERFYFIKHCCNIVAIFLCSQN